MHFRNSVNAITFHACQDIATLSSFTVALRLVFRTGRNPFEALRGHYPTLVLLSFHRTNIAVGYRLWSGT